MKKKHTQQGHGQTRTFKSAEDRHRGEGEERAFRRKDKQTAAGWGYNFPSDMTGKALHCLVCQRYRRGGTCGAQRGKREEIWKEFVLMTTRTMTTEPCTAVTWAQAEREERREEKKWTGKSRKERKGGVFPGREKGTRECVVVCVCLCEDFLTCLYTVWGR